MTIQELWCKNCGINYTHQFSGGGCFNQQSSQDYCKECNTVVQNALLTKPKKVYIKIIECPDFGKDFQDMVDIEFTKALDAGNRMWTLLRWVPYMCIEVRRPEKYRFTKMTLYCRKGEKVLCKGRFKVGTDELIEII